MAGCWLSLPQGDGGWRGREGELCWLCFIPNWAIVLLGAKD